MLRDSKIEINCGGREHLNCFGSDFVKHEDKTRSIRTSACRKWGRKYGKSKHNCNIWRRLLFRLKTTCFAPFTGPSSGLKWRADTCCLPLNKRFLQILQLCFDLPYRVPHLHIIKTTGMSQLKILHVGLLQECTNSGCLVYRATKLCTVQPNIFNTIMAVFPYIKSGVTIHMQRA
jgi:hypothetical protein